MNQAILNRSRSDKFLMVLEIPSMLKKKYDKVLDSTFKADSLQFTIYGSPVPSISVPAIDLPFDGQVYKASSMSRPAYDPLSIKFFVDNGYKNYWMIWQWLNLFNDAKTSSSNITIQSRHLNIDGDSKMSVSMKDLISRFSIFALDEYNNRIISFDYTDAFPISLGELNFSHQDSSEVSCNVNFAFNQLQVNLLKNVNEATC